MMGNDVGNEIQGDKADVSKWVGLRPVMTYADVTKYDTYQWYTKNANGNWISGDPFKIGDDKYAGHGKVPIQHVIPPELAGSFLSKDGNYWQPWREIDDSVAIPNLNIFRIKQKFSCSSATIAMHIPYTYTYEQEFLDRLQRAKLPGVSVDLIGMTPEKRKIDVIRVEDPSHVTPMRIDLNTAVSDWKTYAHITINDTNKANAVSQNNIIVLSAGEHATEYSSSWIIDGNLRSLISESANQNHLLKNRTWLLIPIEDPDGSYNSTFDNLTDQFFVHQYDARYGDYTPIEVIAYANYLKAFDDNRQPIIVAVSFHNIECNEDKNIYSPWAMVPDYQQCIDFDQYWFPKLNLMNYITENPVPLAEEWLQNRLYGLCWVKYGALALAFEVNDRYPTHRLSLNELQSIGTSFVSSLQEWLEHDIGQKRIKQTSDWMLDREAKNNKNKPLHVNRIPDLFSLLSAF
jgi:hypothetical protein